MSLPPHTAALGWRNVSKIHASEVTSGRFFVCGGGVKCCVNAGDSGEYSSSSFCFRPLHKSWGLLQILLSLQPSVLIGAMVSFYFSFCAVC